MRNRLVVIRNRFGKAGYSITMVKKIVCLTLLGVILTTACAARTDDSQQEIILSFAVPEADAFFYNPLINSFKEEYPHLTVQLTAFGSTADGVLSLAESADVVLLENINPATQPGFLNLDPLFEGDSALTDADFWPGLVRGCSASNGQRYGLPIDVSPFFVYYDRDIFDQNNLPYPQSDWTYQQFQSLVQQISQVTDGQGIYAFMDNFYHPLLEPLVAGYGANDGDPISEALYADIDWYLIQAEAGTILPFISGNHDQPDKINLIRSGKIAMWIDTLDHQVVEYSTKNFGRVPFPGLTAGENYSPVNFTCAAISAGSRFPKESWLWLKYLAGAGIPADQGRIKIPANKNLAANSLGSEFFPEEIREEMQVVLNHLFVIPVQDDVFQTVMSALYSALLEDQDFRETLRNSWEARDGVAQVSPTVPVVVVNTPIPTPASDISRIRFMANWGTNEFLHQDLQNRIAAFEDTHPFISIQYPDQFNHGGSEDLIQTFALNFDCFVYYDSNWGAYPAGDLLDLTPFIIHEGAGFEEDFPAYLVDLFTVDGKVYALPADVSPTLILFNTDLLSQNGLPLPAGDWTITDLINLASGVTAPSAVDPVYGFTMNFDVLLHTQDISWLTTDTEIPTARLNSPEMIRAVNWIKDLYDQGIYLPSDWAYWAGTGNYLKLENLINQGKIGFWTGYDDGQKFTAALGYQKFPHTVNHAPMGFPVSTLGYYISAHAQNPQACWEWIKDQSGLPSVFGGVSPRFSVLQSEQAAGELGEELVPLLSDVLRGYDENDQPQRTNVYSIPYSQMLSEAIVAVLNGQAVDPVFYEAQQKADQYYACVFQTGTNAVDPNRIYAEVVLPCVQRISD